MYPRGESNPHSRRNWILNPARLPVPPQGHSFSADGKSIQNKPFAQDKDNIILFLNNKSPSNTIGQALMNILIKFTSRISHYSQ